jgi:hypothetical protein
LSEYLVASRALHDQYMCEWLRAHHVTHTGASITEEPADKCAGKSCIFRDYTPNCDEPWPRHSMNRLIIAPLGVKGN